MPRDGFEIYNIPAGTHGEPDTTIESARYNAFVDDIALDLNAPRPILSGGTGADDKVEALQNLDGEMARQLITNFDSDTLYPGSFHCATTATGSPVTGHAFQGWIYQTDNNNMVIQARDRSDTMIPGRLYSREKRAGVWSTWKKDGTTIVGDAEGIASETGDMFFGIKGTAPASKFIVNSKADVTGTDLLTVNRAGASSFHMLADKNAYISADATKVTVTFGNDAASPVAVPANIVANPLTITGNTTVTGTLNTTGLITTPRINFNTAANYIFTDGTNLILRSDGGTYFQRGYDGYSWGRVDISGLVMSYGSISTPGNVTAGGVVISQGNHYNYGCVYYFNSSNSRYLQWVNDYFNFNAHVYSAAGRLYGSGDFAVGSWVSNGRLAFAADLQMTYALNEPYGGAAITGSSTPAVHRFRWVQLYTTGWFTVGLA